MTTKVEKEVLSLIHDINSPLCTLKSLFRNQERNKKLEKLAFQRFYDLSKRLNSHFYNSQEHISSLLDSVENVISLKEVEHPKIVFSLHIHPGLRDLVFDFSQINFERCLCNIINNAVEAGATQILVKINSVNNDVIQVKIVDNGNGFYASTIKEIHKKAGFTTKENGSGLGLQSSLSFMEGLNGDLKIFSTPFIGSSIILSFPQYLFQSIDYGFPSS